MRNWIKLRRGFSRRRLTIMVAVSAMTLLGLAAGAGAAQGKVPGPSGQIVFARYDPTLDDTITYTANPDGTHLKRLFPGASELPHWSPDGSRVSILACADPPVCDTAAVIVNPDTGSYRVLTMPDPTLFTPCFIWSPDAKRLACEAASDTDPNRNGIYTINSSNGERLTRITSNPGGDDLPIDYSPNGKRIVFGRTDPTRPASSNTALFVVNANGTNVHQITPWGFFDDDGSWSPDGRLIAFEHSGSLFVVHPDGTGLTKISLALSGRYAAGDFSWSPDGTQIMFLLFKPDGSEGIATANADGSNVRQVTVSPTFDHEGDWGPHPLAR